MPDGAILQQPESPGILDRLPAHVLSGLTVEQRNSIAAAAREGNHSAPPVNLRLSVPFFTGPIYLTIMAGRERRSPQRLRRDRRANPLKTVGNFAFVLFAAIGFYAVAAGAILAYSSVIEF